MVNCCASITNYVTEGYLNDTKIYMFYKVKRHVINTCIIFSHF